MTLGNRLLAKASVLLSVMGVAAIAQAETETPTSQPYSQQHSQPWQLRSAASGDLVRLESTVAVFNDDNGNLDRALISVLSGSHQWTPHWASVLRLGFASNDAPGAALDGSSFVNPLVGVTYALDLNVCKLAFFGGITLPVGTGGGNNPNLRAAKTNEASATARPLDAAMFAANYLTTLLGADVVFVGYGVTAQAEVNLQQFARVRGDGSASAIDPFRTQAALALHLGYFIGSHFSLGVDLRYQRWLSHPKARSPTGAHVPLAEAKMDTLTLAAGPRVHIALGHDAWIRPGLSFLRGFDAQGLSAPLLTRQTTALMLDIPVTFE